MSTRNRKPPRAPRARRPVLGNDPFARGAAPRAAAVIPDPVPATGPQAAPTLHSEPVPGHPAAPPVAAEPRAPVPAREAPVGEGEAQLAEAARRTGPAAYTDELRELLVRLLPALRDSLAPLASLATLLGAPARLDEYGMDPDLPRRARAVLEFFLDTWWRVDVHGAALLPEQPVVIVANHGGSLAWDALVLRASAARPPAPRELRPLLDARALAAPLLGPLLVRMGAAPLRPDVALSLLDRGTSIALFPEGPRDAPRPWGDRYRVTRFGRGGFARVASLARAPIVPCAIVGSEEASAPFDRRGWLAEALRLPLLAVAPPLPIASPLGWLPLPSRWSIRFGAPVAPPPPEKADDAAAMATVAERVRAELQRMLDADLGARRSVFL
jgi:1-acyl-sn-glycerol-3-phosphate acyltransferase